MWEILRLDERDAEGLSSALTSGYEPFAVTSDSYATVIWFKRKVKQGYTRTIPVKEKTNCDS